MLIFKCSPNYGTNRLITCRTPTLKNPVVIKVIKRYCDNRGIKISNVSATTVTRIGELLDQTQNMIQVFGQLADFLSRKRRGFIEQAVRDLFFQTEQDFLVLLAGDRRDGVAPAVRTEDIHNPARGNSPHIGFAAIRYVHRYCCFPSSYVLNANKGATR